MDSKPQAIKAVSPSRNEARREPSLSVVLDGSGPLLQRLHAFFDHERYSLGRSPSRAPPPRSRQGAGSDRPAPRQPPTPAAGPSPYYQRLQRHAMSRRQHAARAAPASSPAPTPAEDSATWRRAAYFDGAWTCVQWPLLERGAEPRRSGAELRAWVQRELHVLLPGVECTLILTLVLALLGTPGSRPDAIRALDAFLGPRTAHFWHELRYAASSCPGVVQGSGGRGAGRPCSLTECLLHAPGSRARRTSF